MAFVWSAGFAGEPPAPPSVFGAPRERVEDLRIAEEAVRLFSGREYAKAEELLLAAVKKSPRAAIHWYNLACAQALLGKTDAALVSLGAAVEHGYFDAAHMEADSDLESLRATAKYKEIVEAARAAGERLARREALPRLVANGIAMVGEENTVWQPAPGFFRVLHAFPPKPTGGEITRMGGREGELLAQWAKEGTAAGLHGILYENHDRGHSMFPCGEFPELARIEYCDAAKALHLDNGLQARLVHNMPVIGNSSTAMVGGDFWRSNPRLAMINPGTIAVQYVQYTSNQLYFYPEHNDYDAGRNGQGGGHGDVYPANTPFYVTSQGSSGSDQPFLRAFVCTIAAFRPATREKIIAQGLLAPTLQMIFRASNAAVQKPEDYLSGAAHPPVFDAANMHTEAMLARAHAMQPDEIPPFVKLKVVEEELGQVGRDYFDSRPREKLFDTPAAIARVARSTAYAKAMVVSAEESFDANGRPLTWTWRVLCGDAAAIEITPLNSASSVARLRIPWHTRHGVTPGAALECNRVDIGVFANNGVNFSAPAFVSIYYLDSETRVYDDKQRILSVEYRSHANGGNYADPALHTPADWRDEYDYDAEGRLRGWTRIRGDARESFTADGALVTKKDDAGRPLESRAVRYTSTTMGPRTAPRLDFAPGNEIRAYQYEPDAYAPADPERIRRENEKPGTTEWMLTSTRVDPVTKYRCPWIEGYVSRTSALAGRDRVRFFVSTNPPSRFTIDIYRTGYYGGKGGRHMCRLGPFEGRVQEDPPIGAKRVRDCRWEACTELPIPVDWVSGVYVGKLTAEREGLQSYVIFIVRDTRRADFIFQCSDTTWQAYNRWPSQFALYDDGNTVWYWGPNVQVSFNRPYGKYCQILDAPLSTGSGEWFLWEFPFAYFLESLGYDVTYISNLDTHAAGPLDLMRAKGFLSVGHDEYWSAEMYEHIAAAVKEGLSIGFFSGNTCCGRILFAPDAGGTPNRAYERVGVFGPPGGMKDFSAMRQLAHERPYANELVGAHSTGVVTGGADWVCALPEHWIFEGTGMQRGDAIPGLVGWEWHGDPAPIPQLAIVATGPTQSAPGQLNGGTYTATVYPGPRGDFVFNASTCWWADGLAAPPGYVRPSVYTTPRGPDARVQRITRNVLDRMRTR